MFRATILLLACVAYARADGHCSMEEARIHQLEHQLAQVTSNNQALAAAGGMSAMNMLVGFLSGYAGSAHKQQQCGNSCGDLEERIRVLEEHMMHVDEEHSGTWSYEGSDGPEFWYMMAEECAGNGQTPIDFVTSDAVTNTSLTSFQYLDSINAASFEQTSMTLTNNGHALQVNFADPFDVDGTENGEYYLPGDYQMLQFHLHWASDIKHGGSEHTVDGEYYFGEMHIVMKNKKYPEVAEALQHQDGLAVLGFFINIEGEDNQGFEQLLQPIRDGHVVYKGDEYNYPTPVVLNQLMPENLENYWRYEGGLTTPPCSEAVIWTVFHDTLNISDAQARFLMTSLYHGYADDEHNHLINGNYRPIQPLNGRVVSTNAGGM